MDELQYKLTEYKYCTKEVCNVISNHYLQGNLNRLDTEELPVSAIFWTGVKSSLVFVSSRHHDGKGLYVLYSILYTY